MEAGESVYKDRDAGFQYVTSLKNLYHIFVTVVLLGCPIKPCYNEGRRICVGNKATCRCAAGFSGPDCRNGEMRNTDIILL